MDQPSRGLWLAKWLLALPHFIVLAGLWLAFSLSSAAAFVAVLFTGHYPRRLFDFNVGVMRWSWRVAFYAYGVNGTDRYPPFTLAEVPGYPARLEVAYPEHQRSGLPLIGWWLAGIPQYLIVGVFVGGWIIGWSVAPWGGLIGLLVLASAVVLLVRGTYPRSIFDLLLGLNRWVLRVVAYAAVMTPEYPPFRVDPGTNDPAGAIVDVSNADAPTTTMFRSATWSVRRIAALGIASVTGLVAIAAIAAGVTGIVLDQTQRNQAGYLMSAAAPYSTDTYALESESYPAAGVRGFVARELLGTIQIRAQSSRPVFVGIAPATAATAYLAGVAHAGASSLGAESSNFRAHAGAAPRTAPGAERFWVASTTGAGTRTLTWKVRDGSWRVVVMNSDGMRNVASELSIGASAPHLLALALGTLGGGILLLLMSGGGIYLATRRTRSYALHEPGLTDANSGRRFLGPPSIFCAEDMRHDVSVQLAARPGF
jgi:hypothetical protein